MGFLDRFVVRAERDTDSDDTLKRRLGMLSMAELPLWVDTTISQTGKAIQAYLRDGDAAQLEEAKLAANSLKALILELERRTT